MAALQSALSGGGFLFTIVDETGQFGSRIQSGVENSIGSGVEEPANIIAPRSNDRTFSDGAANSLERRLVSQFILSPLNQATGGLATPAYRLGKPIITGAGAAAIGTGVAGLAIFGLQKAIDAINKRVTEMENKAAEANERDNTLIRAGSKNYITDYKGDFWGVNSVNRK